MRYQRISLSKFSEFRLLGSASCRAHMAIPTSTQIDSHQVRECKLGLNNLGRGPLIACHGYQDTKTLREMKQQQALRRLDQPKENPAFLGMYRSTRKKVILRRLTYQTLPCKAITKLKRSITQSEQHTDQEGRGFNKQQ